MKVLDIAAYLCMSCKQITHIKQDDVWVKAPVHCQNCKSVGPWKMIIEDNSFIELPSDWKAKLKRGV